MSSANFQQAARWVLNSDLICIFSFLHQLFCSAQNPAMAFKSCRWQWINLCWSLMSKPGKPMVEPWPFPHKGRDCKAVVLYTTHWYQTVYFSANCCSPCRQEISQNLSNSLPHSIAFIDSPLFPYSSTLYEFTLVSCNKRKKHSAQNITPILNRQHCQIRIAPRTTGHLIPRCKQPKQQPSSYRQSLNTNPLKT